MRIILIILLMLSVIVGFSQKKIRLFDDEQQMKEEILRHFPIGTDTLKVVDEMKKNKFESHTFFQDDLWKESQKIYDKVNYLSFRRTKATSFWISTTWMVRMLFDENGKVTEVIVEIGYTGP